jgi:hypothetical protein
MVVVMYVRRHQSPPIAPRLLVLHRSRCGLVEARPGATLGQRRATAIGHSDGGQSAVWRRLVIGAT